MKVTGTISLVRAVTVAWCVLAATAAWPEAEGEVRQALDRYRLAIETKDLALFQKVRPGLTEAELRRVRAAFDQTRRQASVPGTVDRIQVEGDRAEAWLRYPPGSWFQVPSPPGPRPDPAETDPLVRVRLTRTPAGWVIDCSGC